MTKKVLFSLLICLSIIVVFVWHQAVNRERHVVPDTVLNDVYSLQFDYVAGEDGYEVIESATNDTFLQSYVLVEKSALEEYRTSDIETAPPTISVFIFQLPEAAPIDGEQPGRITRLQQWARENAGLTSFGQIYGTPDIVELDGVRALEYTTDGVYQQTIYLAGYKGNIYMFVGQYDRPTDFIKQDFEQLMQTVRFE